MTSVAERFWSKVDKGGSDECWPWTVGLFSAGYGAFKLNHRAEHAHRMAWALTNGPIPEGKWVLHKCDNRACCNPAHLYLGTHQDNMDGKARRGRSNRKLTNAQRREICRRYGAGGITQQALANEFGVDPTTVSDVVRKGHRSHDK